MPDLRAVLDKLPRDHVVIPIRGERETFITTGKGQTVHRSEPWEPLSLLGAAKAGLPESLSLHGLRKACGRRLARLEQ
jgi:hypothetical protein